MTPYSVMVEQSSSYSSGIELMRQARREYPQLDGIFCTNDDLAVGAAFECQRLGLRSPMIWRSPGSTAMISAR